MDIVTGFYALTCLKTSHAVFLNIFWVVVLSYMYMNLHDTGIHAVEINMIRPAFNPKCGQVEKIKSETNHKPTGGHSCVFMYIYV